MFDRSQNQERKNQILLQVFQDVSVVQLVFKRSRALSDTSKSVTAKLVPKFSEPFVISRVISPWCYELQDDTGRILGTWPIKDLNAMNDEWTLAEWISFQIRDALLFSSSVKYFHLEVFLSAYLSLSVEEYRGFEQEQYKPKKYINFL